jgi:hypothetical protein
LGDRCVDDSKFFPTGPVEDIVLDCYRLARKYSLDPAIFLAKPLSIVKRDLYWSDLLEQKIMEAQASEE